MQPTLHIIGGGLAGSEAAWQAAQAGVQVILHEMRSETRKTEAHSTATLAELVCSNSFRSADYEASAIGCLHEEMRRCGSVILECGDANRLPAGGALAMDRDAFSSAVQAKLENHPNITIVREELNDLPPENWGSCIIATGPLTSPKLSESIRKATGEEHLAFFDAIAPIVYKDSINFDVAWFQSRYDKGTGKDYINCPLTKEQYYSFINALLEGEKTPFKDWEKNTPYFEGCLPIEVMAERGVETLRFGPMKPVGLTNPRGEKPYAVVQLRQDNKLGTLFNMVGFQTKLKYNVQTEIFRQIPGLENAEFARLGGIHRNTFIQSPKVLDEQLRLKNKLHLRFAGQVTGVEGYVESAACGLMAGRFAAAELLGTALTPPPPTTAMGALLNHITGGHYTCHPEQSEGSQVAGDTSTSGLEPSAQYDNQFQPMNVNFGLFPPLADKVGKKDRKRAYCSRALKDMDAWLESVSW